MDKTFHNKTLKHGTEVELYDYVTGDEARRIGIIAKLATTLESELASQDEIIKSVVKSINGDSKDVVTLAKNLRSDEYIEIIVESGAIFTGDQEEKKN